MIAAAGSVAPKQLRAHHVIEADDALKHGGFAHSTRCTRSTALRKILRVLWQEYGSPKLDHLVSRYPGLRPRNVTATEEERNSILALAKDHMRLWILLCSDLALRSGTAAKIGAQHYNPETREIRFQTKFGAQLTMPVTDEIANLIGRCDLDSQRPFVRQLWVRHHYRTRYSNNSNALRLTFRALLDKAGISRRITPHDLRRTTAVKMCQQTRDLYDVQALLGHRSLQATLWYLDHDLRPVQRANLELIKGSRTTKPKGEKTA